MSVFPVNKIRKDFPFLKRSQPYIFFDNAATTQKPLSVIDRLTQFYSYEVAPVFRSAYHAAQETSMLYDQARKTVASFIGAQPHEIIFTAGATDSINAVATSWARHMIHAGDEIIVSQLEHHANFVVWQQLAHERGARLIIVPITDDGSLDMAAFARLLSAKTKLVAMTQVSNVLGTTVDIAQIITQAHAVGARVLVDAAQSIPHQPVNVAALQADFLVFSGHKMLGPTGIGVLFARQKLHEQMQPYRYGGGMVRDVCAERTEWAKPPLKFEAGTPPIAQAIGLAQAINYLTRAIDFEQLYQYEAQLVCSAIDGLKQIKRIRILGPVDQLVTHGHIVNFVIDGIHAHDIAAFLDMQTPSIAIRAGQQCAQLLHEALHIAASARISFYLYNTQEEVEIFLQYIKKLVTIL